MSGDAVALVSGAASGLGASVVERLCESGWTVAALDRRPGDCRADLVIEADVTDSGAVADAVERTVDAFGGLHAVAGCAGIFHNSLTPLHLLSDDDWSSHLDVNLTGSFHLTRAALPHLVAGRGALVLVASIAGEFPQPGGAAYAVSKAGVAALARAVALEYGPRGVRANSVSPGYMDTPMAAPLLSRSRLRAAVEHELPARRVAAPDEVAATVTFLLSPQAGYVNGEDLRVDGAGGLTAFASGDDVDRMWRRNGVGGQGATGDG